MNLCGFQRIFNTKNNRIKILRQKQQKRLIFQAFLWIFLLEFDIINLLKNYSKEVKKSMNSISQISIFDYTEIENFVVNL